MPPMPQPAQPPNQQQPPPNAAAQAAPQQAPSGPPTVYGGITFNNASLTEVIDMLARQLHHEPRVLTHERLRRLAESLPVGVGPEGVQPRQLRDRRRT